LNCPGACFFALKVDLNVHFILDIIVHYYAEKVKAFLRIFSGPVQSFSGNSAGIPVQ